VPTKGITAVTAPAIWKNQAAPGKKRNLAVVKTATIKLNPKLKKKNKFT
jgi:hypothetical protein